MNFNNKALIHDQNCFERKTLEERSKKFGLLKGKSPQRMFWSVVSHQNIDEIDEWIDNFIDQID
ncbi:MAG: hypothetical protein KKC53_06185 [Actinobacteria bacterium]|nr:hypothetical protein [Actinomycetota bacterium]